MSPSFERINTFVFDVDGVLTDGSVWSHDQEEYVRRFYIKDGYAIEKALKAGYHIAIVSGGNEKGVFNRLSFLGIKHICLGVKDKKNTLLELLKKMGSTADTVLYMGDDIPDIAPMTAVALPCAPADAAIDTIHASQFVSIYNGGRGAARDVIERVMRARGDWKPEQW